MPPHTPPRQRSPRLRRSALIASRAGAVTSGAPPRTRALTRANSSPERTPRSCSAPSRPNSSLRLMMPLPSNWPSRDVDWRGAHVVQEACDRLPWRATDRHLAARSAGAERLVACGQSDWPAVEMDRSRPQRSWQRSFDAASLRMTASWCAGLFTLPAMQRHRPLAVFMQHRRHIPFQPCGNAIRRCQLARC